jgi:hypothetical protein
MQDVCKLWAEEALERQPILLQKIAQATQLPLAEVPLLLEELMRFLYLIGQTGEHLTPSHGVDLAWHELILCTRYYAEFCERAFGRFIHHHPGGERSAHYQAFKKTHHLYQQVFGQTPPPQYWGRVIAPFADAADCGLPKGEEETKD